MKNTDDLIAQMERDELFEADFLTPRDIAKVLGTTPQLVYYYIRRGSLNTHRCECGRTVVPVRETIAFFEGRKKND